MTKASPTRPATLLKELMVKVETDHSVHPKELEKSQRVVRG